MHPIACPSARESMFDYPSVIVTFIGIQIAAIHPSVGLTLPRNVRRTYLKRA